MMTMQPVLAFAWNPAVGIPLLIVGVIVLALIWLFGQPRKEQGKRRQVPADQGGERERREPTFDGSSLADDPVFSALDHTRDTRPEPALSTQGELDIGLREELERLGATLSGERAGSRHPSTDPVSAAMPPRPVLPGLAGHAASIVDALRAPSGEAASVHVDSVSVPVDEKPVESKRAESRVPPRSDLGRRPAQLPVERIVTLFVMAREGQRFNGADLVVAAEKAGLEFGDMGIYHRLVDGKRELGPIFSVANMLKPGSFDLSRLDALQTPGVSFFMTLPAPLPALDAWDAMLPTAQRLAELLDGHVLDEERNALGRQGIAHIRDQLRGWDRDHEGKEIIFGR
jgi:cell division protein ZipA